MVLCHCLGYQHLFYRMVSKITEFVEGQLGQRPARWQHTPNAMFHAITLSSSQYALLTIQIRFTEFDSDSFREHSLSPG